MNIESLRMFIKIVDNGSITKTAEQTYISQSALSQQIKTMEQLSILSSSSAATVASH